jgi:RNA polymerase sigma-70 factor (ECF subfamily)
MEPADLESALRTHQAMVYSIAYHFFGGSGVAEEVAQDVFMQLYQTPEPPRSTAHLTAWLRRVTVHRCIDLKRHSAHIHELTVDRLPDVAGDTAMPDPLLRERLRVLIASLPDAPRAAIILRYGEDMDVKDIGDVLHMPVRTVWSHLQRGVALLRAKTAQLLHERNHASIR